MLALEGGLGPGLSPFYLPVLQWHQRKSLLAGAIKAGLARGTKERAFAILNKALLAASISL
jgi:hypothetical protein